MQEKLTLTKSTLDPSPEGANSLATGFASPPDSAKPRVWWHWMNGNIRQEGIRKDLEWMKRVGIGGLQNFDGALETPQVVDERLAYMTPKWQEAFRYATQLAHELGLELAIASSPGWSETGGPWVEPKDGMKKLVWSETRLPSGHAFNGPLAAPPSVSGPFQNIPMADVISGQELPSPRFYQDVAVIAYRTPRALLADPKPVSVTTSAAGVDARPLAEGEQTQAVVLPLSKDKRAWVLYDYGVEQRFRSLSLSRRVSFSFKTSVSFTIEGSTDGQCFERIAELSGDWHVQRATVSFPTVTARYLRLSIAPAPVTNWAGFQFEANSPGAQVPPLYAADITEVSLRELKFHTGARIHHFEHKAGFSIAANYHGLESPPNDTAEAVDPKDIIDLTGSMSAAGTLSWTPPEGEWTVLRLGYSLTGKTNHPASAEATGLEVDKLDKVAVKAYMDHYLSNFQKTVGKEWIGDKGIRAFLTDSIESAGQNWTGRMVGEFKARRGYELTPWFPALTGVIVGDAARSDRFLWDFRRTLIELIAEAHYGQIAESAHERGMTYYSESLEGYATATLGDDLDMRVPADIPMAAIWTSYRLESQEGIINHIIDMLGAASVAHVFGKRFVACESMTSANEPWVFCPGNLKPYMDLAFVLGINRPVVHTSVHQPVEKKPGMSLGCFGQHFTRHETWGEMAQPWIRYLSRCSYLLQQGTFVGDIAWFYGEEGSAANLVSRVTLADFPRGYGFDLVSPKMLREQLTARQGRLVSPAGASYRLLYVGSSAQMTLPVLRKLKALADQGIAIAGLRPTGSPSLADEAHEKEYQQLVSALWGRGKVIDGQDAEAALRKLGVAPDFEYSGGGADSHVRFLHRRLADGEIYFVTNRKARAEKIEARFRVSGKRPELWFADTGERRPVSWHSEQGHTIVSLELGAYDSVFVVFREPTGQTSQTLPPNKETAMMSIDGPWEVTFEDNRGAPSGVQSLALGCWTHNADPGIKYFSGVGTYRKTFTLPSIDHKSNERVLIDLGQVHKLADVALNGTSVGTVWHAPFRLDVTDALKAGANTLEVRIANLWVNRLIGDQQPGATPVAFTVASTYAPSAPLRTSGLLGPVTLRAVSGVSPLMRTRGTMEAYPRC